MPKRKGKMSDNQRKAMWANKNKNNRNGGNGGYGLAPPAIIIPSKPKTFTPNPITFSTKVPEGATLVWMTPQEYIDRVNVRNRMSPERFNKYSGKNEGKILHHPPFSTESVEHIARGLEKGDQIDIPWLDYDREGLLNDQEGFHRAIYAQKLGINHSDFENKIRHDREIPVAIYGEFPVGYRIASEEPEKKMENVLDINRDMEIDYVEK